MYWSMNIIQNSLALIGNTPLVRLAGPSEAAGCDIYGKCAFANPGASVKDRAALYIIQDAEERGLLKPGGRIVEGTAGNTGIGIALVANAKGYKSTIVMPETQSREKMDISDYDRVLVVSHNLDRPIPGAGSCIFIHRWEGPDKATAGCTAMAEKDLIELIDWLRPLSKPRLVQLPKEEAEEWRRQQSIP